MFRNQKHDNFIYPVQIFAEAQAYTYSTSTRKNHRASFRTLMIKTMKHTTLWSEIKKYRLLFDIPSEVGSGIPTPISYIWLHRTNSILHYFTHLTILYIAWITCCLAVTTHHVHKHSKLLMCRLSWMFWFLMCPICTTQSNTVGLTTFC